MKKKILAIGNTDNLDGVPVDINAYLYHFLSPAGGLWNSDEITLLMNPTQRELLDTITDIEEADNDYVIVLFSGHGYEADGETILTINWQGEEIALNELMNLSPRQLLILDCCRVDMESLEESIILEEIEAMLSLSRNPIQKAYEERILDSIPQKIVLQACDEGEPAMDSRMGGIYAQYLLDATQIALDKSHSPFITVGSAHRRAVSLMRQDPDVDQHPRIQQPLCGLYRRLPFAINPNFWQTEQSQNMLTLSR